MRLSASTIKLVLLFCIPLFVVQPGTLLAQTAYPLPPNQPEQDACHAIQLCGGAFFTPYSYTGRGAKLDLDSTPCSPKSGGGEVNSVWFEIHTSSAGNVAFTIKPVNVADDYDFAVVDITGKSCSDISLQDVIRCNYNTNSPNNPQKGATGLTDTSRTPYVHTGLAGSSFSQPVFAKVGGDYLIMVNNSGNYGSGVPSKGFTIDFTGSTAVFNNVPNPEISNIEEICNDNSTLIVHTSTDVLCHSIALDGSDFFTNAPPTIVSASATNCTDRGGYTNSITLHFSSPLPAGKYTLNAKNGSDNNTLSGFCDNQLALPSNPVPFIVKPGKKVAIEDESVCYQLLPYEWHGIPLSNGGDSVATFTTTSVTGCDSITILNLHVSPAPRQVKFSATACDGDTYTLPWKESITTAGTYTHHYSNSNGCDTLVQSVAVTYYTPPNGDVQARDSTYQTGFCRDASVLLDPGIAFTSYVWNTGQTSRSIIVNIAGSYSLLAKDAYGCNTIDTFAVALYPRPTANFNRTETLCPDTSKLLDGGSGYVNYLWNTGSTDETVTVNGAGTFWVRLTDKRNCTGTDTVTIVPVPRPANFLISAVTKCSQKSVTLLPSGVFSSYNWSNGHHTNNIEVLIGGLYWLTVTDYHGCTGRDSVIVTDSLCPVYFSIPTAFTPNNDGHNDFFKPTFKGTLADYHFSVFDRWGRLVFSSVDAFIGWDGALSGYPQPVGTYLWICSYRLDNQNVKTEKGSVTLIR